MITVIEGIYGALFKIVDENQAIQMKFKKSCKAGFL